MQPRTLDQIISELNPTYDPQIKSLRERQGLIPGQVAEEEKGLQAKQEQAFGDILGGARHRGLGFSGIPLSEQARYTSTEFLPALARLRQQGKEQAMSLEDAILGITERRNTLAQQLRQQEVDRAEQIRQFNEQMAFNREQAAAQERASMAAAGGGFSPSFGGLDFGGGVGGAATGSAQMQQRNGGGFNFQDANGRPISAAQYAAAKKIPFRQLLSTMAKAGDKGAVVALQFVGNDYGYDPRKVTTQNLANIYNSLVWGTGKKAMVGLPTDRLLR